MDEKSKGKGLKAKKRRIKDRDYASEESRSRVVGQKIDLSFNYLFREASMESATRFLFTAPMS